MSSAFAQAARTLEQNPPEMERTGRVAVILNKNAKRVSRRVRRHVEAAAPAGADIFFTESLEQARFITRRVVDSRYDLVVTGGGDGTVANTIAQVVSHCQARGYEHAPRFAVLRLGTGNAVADFLNAGHYRDDLRRLDGAAWQPIDLLHIDGQHRATFAGVGWDAYILNNYDRMRAVAERTPVTRALFKTVAGYLIAGVGKSVPELIVRRPAWNVRVVNTGGIGLKVDHSGRVVERIAPGATAFTGRIRLACFGTTPYYGFKFNIMPHAHRTPGMFHLRLVDMHPLAAVRELPAVWTGRTEHPGIVDFQLSGCRLEFDQPVPFQISGDAAGLRDSIEVGLDQPIHCARFPA
ncbi:MAG: hypothetical protein KC620_04640 [Myxococcales bacterium]|nr:hypothetical protein [Myxococcales bacterium]